jgi:hypothetical protein
MPAPGENPRSLSAFADKASPPTAAALNRALGPAATAWRALVRQVGSEYSPIAEQWNFASAKFGWSLRLKKADRVVLYLTPQAGRFLVGIVLGAKAVAAARDADLPPAVLEAIAEAPRNAEGSGIRFPVEDGRQVAPILTLVALKMGRP